MNVDGLIPGIAAYTPIRFLARQESLQGKIARLKREIAELKEGLEGIADLAQSAKIQNVIHDKEIELRQTAQRLLALQRRRMGN